MANLPPHAIHDREDTKRFLATVDGARADVSSPYFDARAPVFISRAPGRLDLMGGIADYSGSLVLELPIASATHVALERHDEATLEIVSLAAGFDSAPAVGGIVIRTIPLVGARCAGHDQMNSARRRSAVSSYVLVRGSAFQSHLSCPRWPARTRRKS